MEERSKKNGISITFIPGGSDGTGNNEPAVKEKIEKGNGKQNGNWEQKENENLKGNGNANEKNGRSNGSWGIYNTFSRIISKTLYSTYERKLA